MGELIFEREDNCKRRHFSFSDDHFETGNFYAIEYCLIMVLFREANNNTIEHSYYLQIERRRSEPLLCLSSTIACSLPKEAQFLK